MFWNTEFLDSSPSHIDVLLQTPTAKLSDILYEDDLLQELKTSNVTLTNFLTRPEIIVELVDNITLLTEKDCCDKLLYSRVHAAYISCEILTGGSSEIFAALMNHPESLKKIIACLTETTITNESTTMTKVVPQKATLVSKLISNIHSLAAENLSCHITQDIDSFTKLINLLVQNIDVSGSFEILSTFIKPTSPHDKSAPELRYVFCELLSKLNFVNSLIDVMTLSDIEDKQRNACQLLCDIIVIGRQDASEQTNSGPMAQDMLAEFLESTQAVHVILNQMFTEDMRNSTTVVCGMKVLQTLLEKKPNSDAQLLNKTIEQTQEEIEKHLIRFHELLLNPPKQEPIKTTFGIIQKPLGYMRLEVVNLIKALISTNSPNIIRKLVELKTLKVIIDLFVEYSWNNLLHTQVEQALCMIIQNFRHDEEASEAAELQQQQQQQQKQQNQQQKEIERQVDVMREEEKEALDGEKDNDLEKKEEAEVENENRNGSGMEEETKGEERDQHQGEKENENETIDNVVDSDKDKEEVVVVVEQEKEQERDSKEEQLDEKQISTESSSRALLSQLLDECDLIGRLLLPTSRDGEQANFGHIIQMINSIAINRDLDVIRDHLVEMKDRRPELFDRWTTFVNVDVASFKEVSLYYDAQSANVNNVNHRFGHTQHQFLNNIHTPTNNSLSDNNVNNLIISNSNNSDDAISCAYYSFTKETVIPTINVDVIPRLRRSKNAH